MNSNCDKDEINKLQQRILELEKFCAEFVYGEENPDYYKTMDEKISKRDELLDQASFEISHILKYCPVLAMSIMTRLREWLNQVQKLRENKG